MPHGGWVRGGSTASGVSTEIGLSYQAVARGVGAPQAVLLDEDIGEDEAAPMGPFLPNRPRHPAAATASCSFPLTRRVPVPATAAGDRSRRDAICSTSPAYSFRRRSWLARFFVHTSV